MDNYITLETNRTGYSIDQCGTTLTVKQLTEYLNQFDEDTPVYYRNDDGYTYGKITFDDIVSRREGDEDDE